MKEIAMLAVVWGDVATWISAIATFVAAGVALYLGRLAIKQQRNEEAQRRSIERRALLNETRRMLVRANMQIRRGPVDPVLGADIITNLARHLYDVPDGDVRRLTWVLAQGHTDEEEARLTLQYWTRVVGEELADDERPQPELHPSKDPRRVQAPPTLLVTTQQMDDDLDEDGPDPSRAP